MKQIITSVIGGIHEPGYSVYCDACGADVTIDESEFTTRPGEATVVQAGIFRQRHLAKHLTALAAEITEAAR